jgi:hypothetical protein
MVVSEVIIVSRGSERVSCLHTPVSVPYAIGFWVFVALPLRRVQLRLMHDWESLYRREECKGGLHVNALLGLDKAS